MKNEILNLSTELLSAVKTIKTAILQSQYRAAKSVNREQLSLYFGIGRYISEHSRKGYWGTGAIETISEQLQRELPGLKGFGATSMKYMRLFYENWNTFLIRQPSADKMTITINRQPTADELGDTENRPPVAGDLIEEQNSLTTVSGLDSIDISSLLSHNRQTQSIEIDREEFLSISFSHHIEILTKTKNITERIFYIHQTYLNKWDKYRLRDMLKADLYHHQGSLPNNFAKAIPTTASAIRAIEMFKDEYLLDFINVEEIGVRDEADVDEREVEQAIVQNVKNFIMTFGRDFTFVGNQYHLEKYGHHSYPDLLFYNRELAALVVVELLCCAQHNNSTTTYA